LAAAHLNPELGPYTGAIMPTDQLPGLQRVPARLGD